MKKRWLTGITILTMAVVLTACGEIAKTPETTDSKNTNSKQEVSSIDDNNSPEGASGDTQPLYGLQSESETTETKSENTSEEQADSSQTEGIRPEFQEAMDSYEAFFDEYISFMKEYKNASQDDVLGMMGEYTNYLKQYAETMSKMEALDDGDLSAEEALYYAEVTNRISKKLIEAAQ